MERFDAIGRRRDKDLAGRPIDTKTKLPDGSEIDGLAGLRDYLLGTLIGMAPGIALTVVPMIFVLRPTATQLQLVRLIIRSV